MRFVAWVVCLTAAATAHAGDVVVYDGTDEAARAAVLAVGGEPGELRAFDDLRAGAPIVVEGGAATLCAGAARPAATLETLLEKARADFLYGDYERALSGAQEALDACEASPLPPQSLARAQQLLGAIAALSGEDGGPAFAAAKAIDPALPWDVDLSEAPRAGYEATPVAATVQLRVVAPSATALAVDGRPAGDTVEVVAGRHAVFTGGPVPSVRVELLPGSTATLVVPSAFSGVGLADEARRPQLAALFAAAFGEGQAVTVVAGDRVYAATAGRSDWKTLLAPTVDRPRKRSPGAPLLATGLVVGAAGGASYIAFDRLARGVLSDRSAHCGSAPSWDATACEEARKKYNRDVAGTYAGAAVGGVGLATAIGGLIAIGTRRAEPAWVGGPGLTVKF